MTSDLCRTFDLSRERMFVLLGKTPLTLPYRDCAGIISTDIKRHVTRKSLVSNFMISGFSLPTKCVFFSKFL
jgi:hypothetical protein